MQATVSCDLAYLMEQFALSDTGLALYRAVGNAELIREMQGRQQLWLRVCAHVAEYGVHRTTLRKGTLEQWCIITPDPTPGFHRYTCFDRRGFFAHGTYATAEEALVDAFKMGYRSVTHQGTLERISSLAEWKGGD